MVSQQQIDDAQRIKSLHSKRNFLKKSLKKTDEYAARGETRLDYRYAFIRRHLRRVNAELKYGPGAYDQFLAYVASALPKADKDEILTEAIAERHGLNAFNACMPRTPIADRAFNYALKVDGLVFGTRGPHLHNMLKAWLKGWDAGNYAFMAAEYK